MCAKSLCFVFFFLGRAILSCPCVVLHESSFSLLLFSRGMRELVNCVHLLVVLVVPNSATSSR